MARGGIFAFKREPSKPHRCEYHKDGIQCGQFAMHNEYVCYQHRIDDIPTVIENDPFLIEHLDDRATLQKALADVASRLACNRMDLKRAGLLLYNLQIAATNLDCHERNQATLAAQQLAANQPADEPAAPDAITLTEAPQSIDPDPAPVILSEAAQAAESKDPESPDSATTSNTVPPQTPLSLQAAAEPTVGSQISNISLLRRGFATTNARINQSAQPSCLRARLQPCHKDARRKALPLCRRPKWSPQDATTRLLPQAVPLYLNPRSTRSPSASGRSIPRPATGTPTCHTASSQSFRSRWPAGRSRAAASSTAPSCRLRSSNLPALRTRGGSSGSMESSTYQVRTSQRFG